MREAETKFCPGEIDPKTHARTAGESHKPLFQISRGQPSLRDEFVWPMEDIRVVMDKGAANGHNCLYITESGVNKQSMLGHEG